MSSKNAIAVWDLTLPKNTNDFDFVKKAFREVAKKWTFQEEVGLTTGYNHYQARISLKAKTRSMISILKSIGLVGHASPTHDADDEHFDFYAGKIDTRVAGPWTDKDVVKKMTRQLARFSEALPWQKDVITTLGIWDPRGIHVLYDRNGNNGKTWLKQYAKYHFNCRPLPFCNDYKEVMRMVMDMPDADSYIFDIPRAINKDKLFQLYAAIETIKDGYAFDDRYHFKEKDFDSPVVWVFTNTLPDMTLMSRDRWNIWTIGFNNIQAYKPENDVEIQEETKVFDLDPIVVESRQWILDQRRLPGATL